MNRKQWQATRPKTSRPVKIPPDQLEALNEAIHVFGIVILADKMGITIATIQNWRTRGLPAERAIELETLTRVDRKRLRPDLYT